MTALARFPLFLAVTIFCTVVSFPAVRAAGEPSEPNGAASNGVQLNPDADVAAYVDGQPILVREVEEVSASAIGGQPADADATRIVQAQTLDKLIQQRLILRWLAATGKQASEADVDLAIERLRNQLKQQGKTLTRHLLDQGIDEPQLRRKFTWQISWQQFLQRYLTDENLRKFFDRHHADFDGSRMRVAHILLKVSPGDASSLESQLQAAAKLREEILSGKLSFVRAAEIHSAAPTARDGGDIGFIERREPMPDSFSDAAFALKANEISPPVVTPFGVHLIRCLEIQPGSKTWQAAREDLEEAVARFLFNWAADQGREGASIRYTGHSPHFIPGTTQLAGAEKPATP